MMMHQWRAENGEGALLKNIYTGSKSIEIASAKIKARFGDNACFVKLVYDKEVPMKLETIRKGLA